MLTLQNLRETKDEKGNYKSVVITPALKKLIDRLTLTKENERFATPIINVTTKIRYEPATFIDGEGVRIENKNIFGKIKYRIYRTY